VRAFCRLWILTRLSVSRAIALRSFVREFPLPPFKWFFTRISLCFLFSERKSLSYRLGEFSLSRYFPPCIITFNFSLPEALSAPDFIGVTLVDYMTVPSRYFSTVAQTLALIFGCSFLGFGELTANFFPRLSSMATQVRRCTSSVWIQNGASRWRHCKPSLFYSTPRISCCTFLVPIPRRPAWILAVFFFSLEGGGLLFAGDIGGDVGFWPCP